MATTFKWTVTKPSLQDSFIFEIALLELHILHILQNIIPDAEGSLGYPSLSLQMFVKPSGYIRSYTEDTITWDEISNKINDVREDLKDFLTTPCYENGLSGEIPLDIFKNSSAVPPFNPFTTTYTLVMEFDTWDNFVLAYNNDEDMLQTISDNSPPGLALGLTYNEEVYEDGVLREFAGKFNTL